MIRSLAGIAEGLGVRFRYNSPAARIDVDGGRATGVTLEGGERLHADVVVSNADLPYTYAELLPPEPAARRLQGMKYTSSALIFYWAVKGERSSELLHHNVFLADHRYRELFDSIFRDLSLPEEPSFYVCAPTRTEPTFAPPEGDSLMALVPVGHLTNAACGTMRNARKSIRNHHHIPHSELRERAPGRRCSYGWAR